MAKGKKGKTLDPIQEAQEKQQKINEKKIELQAIQETEEKNATINNHKIVAKWRLHFQKEKINALKSETHKMQDSNTHTLQIKKNILDRLSQDVLDSEHQFSTALQSHLIHIQNLASLQDARCSSLLKGFDVEKVFLEQSFNFERTQFLGAHLKNKTDVLGVVMRLEREFNENESDMRHEWNSTKEDIRSKHLEEKHALRIQLEATIEELWRQFQTALDQYTNNTEEKRKQFQELKTKDLKNANEIEHQMKKLVFIQDHITNLKSKIAQKTIAHQNAVAHLQQRKSSLSLAFRTLKKQCNTFQSKQQFITTDMLSSSQKAIKNLDKKKEFAERILSLHILIEKMGHSTDYNSAIIDNMKLETHLETLNTKNAQLKQQLNQYLDGWNVRENIMDTQNTLLMVNCRYLSDVTKKRDTIPVIDAPTVTLLYESQGYF